MYKWIKNIYKQNNTKSFSNKCQRHNFFHASKCQKKDTWMLGANRLGWSVKNSTILPISCFNKILLSRCMASQDNIACLCTSLKKSISFVISTANCNSMDESSLKKITKENKPQKRVTNINIKKKKSCKSNFM